jgi:hypothetical protein
MSIPDDVKAEVIPLLKGLLALVIGGMTIGFVLMKVSSADVPRSLDKANLSGRVWSQTDVDLARKVTHKQLSVLATALDEADRKGDTALVWAIMPESTEVLKVWGDQSEPIKSMGHDCILAAMHISNGLGTVAAGRGWDQARFKAALQDC